MEFVLLQLMDFFFSYMRIGTSNVFEGVTRVHEQGE